MSGGKRRTAIPSVKSGNVILATIILVVVVIVVVELLAMSFIWFVW